MKLLIIIPCFIFLLFSCTIEEENVPKDTCKADVQIALDYTNKQYGFNLVISNSGEKDIVSVKIPYKITFDNGQTDSRTIFTPPTISIAPGQHENVEGFITPADQTNSNPRYISYKEEIDKVDYESHECRCD